MRCKQSSLAITKFSEVFEKDSDLSKFCGFQWLKLWHSNWDKTILPRHISTNHLKFISNFLLRDNKAVVELEPKNLCKKPREKKNNKIDSSLLSEAFPNDFHQSGIVSVLQKYAKYNVCTLVMSNPAKSVSATKQMCRYFHRMITGA